MRLIKLSLTLSILFLFSCATPVVHQIKQPDKREYPTESFVKMEYKITNPKCKEDASHCEKENLILTGSGAFIQGSQDSSYILTAAHVCEPNLGIRFDLYMSKNNLTEDDLQMYAVNIKEKMFKVETVVSDHKNDICVMKTDRKKSKHELKVSKTAPERSRMYYNMSAPLGIFQKDTVLLFDGLYAGRLHLDGRSDFDTYTIPSAGGSSGSPILDSNGEVVGLVSMGPHSFKHITLSPKWTALKGVMNNL